MVLRYSVQIWDNLINWFNISQDKMTQSDPNFQNAFVDWEYRLSLEQI